MDALQPSAFGHRICQEALTLAIRDAYEKAVRIPNKTTARTFKETDTSRGMVCCQDAQELFGKLGI